MLIFVIPIGYKLKISSVQNIYHEMKYIRKDNGIFVDHQCLANLKGRLAENIQLRLFA